VKTLKWGVLGISGHYKLRVHRPLKGLEGAELYSIASRDTKRAAEAAEAFGFIKSYGSYQALIDDEGIDAVYLPLPNDLHLEWIKKAADAGKHIVCEKPLCMSSAEVDEAFAYCADKGVFLMEAFMFRFHPQWIKIKEMVDIGELGELKSIQCIFSYDNTDPRNIRNKAENGGGAMRDIGCYGVAVSNLLLGREPLSVQSLIDNDPIFKTDQLTSFMMDFGNCHSIVTVSTQLFDEQKIRILGTGGSVEVKVPFNTANDVPAEVTMRNGIDERTIRTPAVDQYRCEFEKFTEAVLNNDAGFFSMMEAFSKRNQKVIDSVFEAGDM